MELNQGQIQASLLLENWWYSSNDQVFELCGAAGTGKTTIVRYLIEQIGLSMDEVLFVAFMGKAATCLQRNGLPAKTIHSACYTYHKVPMRDENGKKILDEYGLPKMKLKFELKESIGSHIKLIVVDEGGQVNTEMARDLLSFGLPMIVLGDLNQLPPVFGKSYFLQKPDYVLKQIMRQSEGSPIIYLSQCVLNDRQITPGIYGDSAVIRKDDLNDYTYKKADVVLTFTNKLRSAVNTMFREHIKKFKDLDVPHQGESIICRKNNWNKELDGVFLTNGMTGYIDYMDLSSLKDGAFTLDFRPDFSIESYKNLRVDFNTLMGEKCVSDVSEYDYGINKFEFGYALTTHLSQGSQWDDVLVLAEPYSNFSPELKKKIMYTAITRARKRIVIAI